MIYSRLLFLYGPSLCLRRPPARPRRPPASSPRREARTGVCVLRARFLCIRLFIRFGTPPAAFRSAPSHRTRRLLPHGRGNGVRLFAPRLHTAQELYLCFFGSARPRAAFPRRRNKPAPLRPVPPAPHSAAHRPAAARRTGGGDPAQQSAPNRTKAEPFVPHCLSAELYLRRNPAKFRRTAPKLFLPLSQCRFRQRRNPVKFRRNAPELSYRFPNAGFAEGEILQSSGATRLNFITAFPMQVSPKAKSCKVQAQRA